MAKDKKTDELDRTLEELKAEILEELVMTEGRLGRQRQQQEEPYSRSSTEMGLPNRKDTIH